MQQSLAGESVLLFLLKFFVYIYSNVYKCSIVFASVIKLMPATASSVDKVKSFSPAIFRHTALYPASEKYADVLAVRFATSGKLSFDFKPFYSSTHVPG